MPQITLLSQDTIDKIAAGEVIERPCSVVKELVENAIDAGATAITVEIKEGGISFIRITDNGCGIEHSQVPIAFLRHSTSKIKKVEDLLCVKSLGFRGEALSSIAAISRVELITKTDSELTGTRYLIEGSKEVANEEIGAPDGTTFLIKDLFYNTPARRKFLKTPKTEGNYISDMLERLALSHPDISFKYISNNQTKLHTSGNGNVKDLIYHIFGRDITSALLPVSYKGEFFHLTGFIGKPIITRGNRNYENYFINGRYIKSSLIAKSIEEAYKNFMMLHQYPFCVLYFEFPGELLDVNVHPTKMELRFGHNQEVYKELYETLFSVLSGREMIPQVPVDETETTQKEKTRIDKTPIPEPFETRRRSGKQPVITTAPVVPASAVRETTSFQKIESTPKEKRDIQVPVLSAHAKTPPEQIEQTASVRSKSQDMPNPAPVVSKKKEPDYQEITLGDISKEFLSEESRKKHRIIGQLFKTYWLIEFEDKLFIIDQHAAHEKVLYERTMASLKKKEYTSQTVSPPIILSLDARESEMLEKFRPQIEQLGYVVEPFGGKEYMISGIPGNLFHMDMKDLFIEMLDDFSNLTGKETPELILEKVATMSCKAAVKGNTALSLPEIEALIDELLTLDNPYNCPHGRPTIISMSKYDIEKKFKRIV